MTQATRVIPQPHRSGRLLIEQLVEDVRRLQRQAIQADDQGRVQVGPLYIIARENDDGTVAVQLQNALTEGTPYNLVVRLP